MKRILTLILIIGSLNCFAQTKTRYFFVAFQANNGAITANVDVEVTGIGFHVDSLENGAKEYLEKRGNTVKSVIIIGMYEFKNKAERDAFYKRKNKK